MYTKAARRKAAYLLPRLTAILLAPFCGLLVTCKKLDQPLLRVRVGGCGLLWERSPRMLCATAVEDQQCLIFSIEGPPQALLHFRIGGTADREAKISPTGHLTLNEPFPKVDSQVTLRVDSAGGVVDYAMDVQLKSPFEKAYAHRRDKLDCGQSARRCLDSAQSLLARLDADPREFDAAEQAFLLGLLGDSIGRAAKNPAPADEADALRRLTLSTLERAMVEARATGLLSVEAVALERLGMALRSQGSAKAQRLAAVKLRDPAHRRALDQYPESRGGVRYLQSRIAEEQGELADAKRYASEAAALAEEFVLGDPSYLVATRLQEALAAQSLQETQETDRLVAQVEKQLKDGFVEEPCQLAARYNTVAWIKLVARQGRKDAADPVPSFEQVAASLLKCRRQAQGQVADTELTVLASNRALYALLRAEEAASGSSERLRQLDDAEAIGRQAREAQIKVPRGTKIDIDIELDLAYLAGRIALLRGQGQDALRAFAQLERLTATERLSPDYRWASQIGQADAHLLRGETEEALRRYARAEALLDRITAGLSMMTRRQLFLSRFEAGTGRYLKLLLTVPGAQGKVLEVIRHARVRALRTYARGPRAGKEQSRTDELLRQYATLLDEREAVQAELPITPLVEMADAQNRLQQRKRKQEEVLEELYTGGAEESAPLELQPPAAGELMIACYPLPAEPGGPPHSWVCTGTSVGDTQVRHLDLPLQATPDQAAQAILNEFGEALRQARHLRILSYGSLRAVAWGALPWSGGRLEERYTISYGVDAPAASGLRPPTGLRALLVTDPQQDLPSAQRVGERLRKELPAAGWQLDARAGAPRHGGHLLALLRKPLQFWQPPPATAQEVVAKLPGVALFVYYGHAESLGPGGWDSRLLFSEEGSISARDIMSLPAVPRKVLLIGCETAVSDREAPADEAGLAQAFVLRGSEAVLATTRKVAVETAEAIVEKLAELGALRPDGPPLAAALRDAIVALRPRYPAVELDSFRVYTP